MTSFQIVLKPTKTLMTLQGVEVVVGQKYDIALRSQLKIENLSSFKGEPFDSFKYRINIDDTFSSNTATVTVSFETNKVGLPIIVTAVELLQLNSLLYFTDVVDPGNHFDRIKITSIAGKGAWTYDNLPLVAGQVLFYYDLIGRLKFVAFSPGAQSNYAVLTYDTMNANGPHLQVNTITINTTSLGAEITLLYFTPTSEINVNTLFLEYTFKISKGIVNAAYEIAIDPGLFPGLDTNPSDTVLVQERDLASFEINTSGTENRTSNLDENGETIYNIRIYKNTVTTEDNFVFVSLNTVDSLIANVNPLYNQITLLIPPTP